jgi:nicotinate-nucleotide adenylyltransferase
MRVGVLGGTFDPVHNAHLILAEHAREQLSLESVLFIPAGEPWRKAHRAITPPEHRLAMLELAIAGNDAFGISDIELRQSGPSYTADTLAVLAGERLDDEFYFIVGSDALADLPNWHEPARIIQHALLAVAPREDKDLDPETLGIPGMADHMVPFTVPRIDISSTAIRARVASGASVRYLVPDSVRVYIEDHALYGWAGSSL